MSKFLQVKKCFLDFFVKNNHKIYSSAQIIPPIDDNSVLFVNSGMFQFKNYFIGKEIAQDEQITTSQVCIRVGGKHNDLENVGYTARHHTMFEMLGNFAFNSVYSKQQAIDFAWIFLTQELNIDRKKLYVTVYHTDYESYNIWKKIFIKLGCTEDYINEHLIKIDTDENFWSVAKDSGPCGPCTEIFYDYGDKIAGGKPGSIDQDGDRYVEIWNVVFMEYEKNSGKLLPLKRKGIDTGMGLERITAVIEGKTNNYESSIFAPIIDVITKVLSVQKNEKNIFSFRVIADHMRTVVYMVHAHIIPLNEGRGYVLKKIIRRMLLHIHKLIECLDENIIVELIAGIIKCIDFVFETDMQILQNSVERVVIGEMKKFNTLLVNGIKILSNRISMNKADEKNNKNDIVNDNVQNINLVEDKQCVLQGDFLFKLYDTYGFPLELTKDFVKDMNIKIDQDGFYSCMKKQQINSKQNEIFRHCNDQQWMKYSTVEFLGYELNSCMAECIDIVDNKYIITDKTVFYAEGGGQKGDRGQIIFNNNDIVYIENT
ncbi:MAG: alanine--tRNA ligase, partial [Pseudomonadota bacterium]